MKKIQFLIIAMTLGMSCFAQAAEAGAQTEEQNLASEIVLHGAALSGVDPHAASFQVNTVVPLMRDIRVARSAASLYLVSERASHVPEPEGWVMMLMGAGFVVYQVRRRKRARASWDLR